MMELMKASVPYYQRSATKLLTLIDFHHIKGSTEFMDLAKRLGSEVFDQKTEKGALLGIHGIKKVLLQGYNLVAKQKIKPFDSKEEALQYLAE